jgi:fatty acyl-CoA reductase
LHELTSSPIFDRLRSQHGVDNFVRWFSSCVQFISFDLEAYDLGLSDESRCAAFSDTDVVIHCAARVSWDERIDLAFKANTLGTIRLFDACTAEAKPQLPPVFVYVSTAFVHGMAPGPHAEVPLAHSSIRSQLEGPAAPPFCIDTILEEAFAKGVEVDAEVEAARMRGDFNEEARTRSKVHAGDAEIQAFEIRIAERKARTQLSEHGITVARGHGWWDPYTFSKAMAEIRLTEISAARGVPLVIVRPSGITCCALQPVPGWIDCYLLNEPIIEAIGKGQLSAFPGREDSVLDMVPADFVVELIIVAATQPPVQQPVPKVYQMASGDINPVHQGNLARWWAEYFREYPFHDAQGRPLTPVQPKLIESLDAFISRMHWRAGVPLAVARIIAAWLPSGARWVQNLRGRVAKLGAAFDNALRLAKLYSVYTIERFEFQSCKSRELLESHCGRECKNFGAASCADIYWKPYFRELHIPGMRKYVLKEKNVEPMSADKTHALSRRKAVSKM